MKTIISTLLLSIYIIQIAKADPIDDVIADLTSKITHTKTTINTILQNGGILIRETRKTIGKTVTKAETEIERQLIELDDVIKQAVQESLETQHDISQCVTSVLTDISGLNFHKIDDCGKNQDLDLLGVEFGNLRIIKEKLSNSISVCSIKNPTDVEALKTCVQDDIDKADRKSDEIRSKMTTVCEEATKTASSCAVAAVEEFDKSITTITHDFKQCLEQIVS